METNQFQIVVDHLVRLSQEITEFKTGQQQFSNKLENIEDAHGGKLNALSEGLEKNSETLNALAESLEKNTQAIGRIEHEHGQKLNDLSENLVKSNKALSEGLEKTNQALARIEHEHGEKLNALFDAREVQLDVNDRILSMLSRIEEKIDHLSIKFAHHDYLLRKY